MFFMVLTYSSHPWCEPSHRFVHYKFFCFEESGTILSSSRLFFINNLKLLDNLMNGWSFWLDEALRLLRPKISGATSSSGSLEG
jgi:hypothetical protein